MRLKSPWTNSISVRKSPADTNSDCKASVQLEDVLLPLKRYSTCALYSLATGTDSPNLLDTEAATFDRLHRRPAITFLPSIGAIPA